MSTIWVFVTGSFFANVLRAIVVGMSLYGMIASAMTYYAFMVRVQMQERNYIRTMPAKLRHHIRLAIIWSFIMSAYVVLEVYLFYNTPIRWETVFFTFTSVMYAYNVYIIYAFEFAALRMLRQQIKDAVEAIEITESGDKI